MKNFSVIFNYEAKKLFQNKYLYYFPIIYGLIILVLLLGLSHGLSYKFLSTYFRWVNISNEKNVFQFLIGKTRIYNHGLIIILSTISAYIIFGQEYQLKTINYIKSGSINLIKIWSAKILLMTAFITVFYIIYLILTYLLNCYILEREPIVSKYQYTSTAINWIYMVFFSLFSLRNALIYAFLAPFLNCNKVMYFILGVIILRYSNSVLSNSFYYNSNFIEDLIVQIIIVVVLVLILFIYLKKQKLWNG